MCLIIFKVCLKIYKLYPARFFQPQDEHGKQTQKGKQVRLGLLTDTDMLLIVEKGTRGGICHGVHQYVNADNKYIKDYYKKKE